ncbi:Uncharacterized ribonuclease [Galdieria sulphuraria]|nr:Uncharacterized ribonuclease [Galdieria sulphuraria]
MSSKSRKDEYSVNSVKCSLLSRHYSEVNTSLNVRIGRPEWQRHLDSGTLLQFRKLEDDWLHWGILLSRGEEKYRVLSTDCSIYEIPHKQIHPFNTSFSLQNDPLLEKFVAKVSNSYPEGRDQRIVNKWDILEKFFEMPRSKFPELLSDFREIIQRYILLLSERGILVSSNICSNVYFGKRTISQMLEEHPLSKEQELFRNEIARASGKSFEEAVTILERDSLRLVDKQRPEVPLATKILKNLGRTISPISSFQSLVELGYYSYYENLFLRASRFSDGFHESVLKAGDEILHQSKDLLDNNSSDRIELKQLPCYSIDDSETIEIDDAVGLDRRFAF